MFYTPCPFCCSHTLVRDQTPGLICHLVPGIARFSGSVPYLFYPNSSAQDLPFFWGSVQLPPDPCLSSLNPFNMKNKIQTFLLIPLQCSQIFLLTPVLLSPLCCCYMSDVTIISLKAELLSSLFLNSTTMASLMPVRSKDLKKIGSMAWVAICHPMNESVHLSKPQFSYL